MTENAPAVRAADEDRDRVALALRDHQVAGRLTLDEFSERLDLAHRARTLGELELLTGDLPATTGAAPVAVPKRKATRWTVSIMGDMGRRTRWRIAGRSIAVALMGHMDLDLASPRSRGRKPSSTSSR